MPTRDPIDDTIPEPDAPASASERAQAESFADLGRSCEADTVEGQPGMQIHTDVRTSPFRPAPAATLVQTYTFDGRPGTDATVIHVVPVGASLLVTSTYGQWTEESLEEGMESFDQCLFRLHKEGRIDMEEALKAADSREGLALKFRLSEGSTGEHDPYADIYDSATQ